MNGNIIPGRITTSWIQPVADEAKRLLDNLGISRDNINFVGHSLGAYVSWEIASRIPGGINNLIALDPALQLPGGYETRNVNFAGPSVWSWGFYGSAAGDKRATWTADESFQFDFQRGSQPRDNHGAVRDAFADFLYQDIYYWSLNRMTPNNDKPWRVGNIY